MAPFRRNPNPGSFCGAAAAESDSRVCAGALGFRHRVESRTQCVGGGGSRGRVSRLEWGASVLSDRNRLRARTRPADGWTLPAAGHRKRGPHSGTRVVRGSGAGAVGLRVVLVFIRNALRVSLRVAMGSKRPGMEWRGKQGAIPLARTGVPGHGDCRFGDLFDRRSARGSRVGTRFRAVGSLGRTRIPAEQNGHADGHGTFRGA